MPKLSTNDIVQESSFSLLSESKVIERSEIDHISPDNLYTSPEARRTYNTLSKLLRSVILKSSGSPLFKGSHVEPLSALLNTPPLLAPIYHVFLSVLISK